VYIKLVEQINDNLLYRHYNEGGVMYFTIKHNTVILKYNVQQL